MQAHLVQPNTHWEDKDANYRSICRLLDARPPARFDLVVLPEMFDTGFSFNLGTTADHDGGTLGFLRQQAKSRGVTIHGGRTVLGPDGRGRNRSTVVGPEGDVLAEYDKIHPFTLGIPGSRESDSFSPGEAAVAYDWRTPQATLRVGCAICYDLRFPEVLRAGLALGAEVFVVPANWPVTRVGHWRTLLRARAIENQAFVLGVNRTGADPTPLVYPGASTAIDPQGEVLAEAGAEECVVSVEIDPGRVRRWRAKFPAWREAPQP
ncbi:MAG: carbon-nitrogen family hydrolase [Phycisphaerae bacterium]|nr:carbon-nitrogen family hydrolase [Phycisphaerae bacterium]